MLQKKRLTPEQAYQKIKHYCGYQERSHAEVREKLYSLGIWKNDIDTLISRLIEEDYLNETRFAESFVGGKFRMKQWGRVKIKYELKQKQVSEYNIKKAMKVIDEENYLKAFNKLFAEKAKSLSAEKNVPTKKRKILDYMIQKGYERDMIMNKLNEL
ncbi:MAG: RecX family transcriptional regulator [Chitinophagaceae bacterium]|nr:RecX family transcriptional regulator [Chitinophagaceae bacterium]